MFKAYGCGNVSYSKIIRPRVRKLGYKFLRSNKELYTDKELMQIAKKCKNRKEFKKAVKTKHPRTITKLYKRVANLGCHIPNCSAKPKLLEEYLVFGQQLHSKSRRELRKSGLLDYKCQICDLGPVWMDRPMILELDHINGDDHDNRINNLRYLCPNCHTQTLTHSAGGYLARQSVKQALEAGTKAGVWPINASTQYPCKVDAHGNVQQVPFIDKNG